MNNTHGQGGRGLGKSLEDEKPLPMENQMGEGSSLALRTEAGSAA